MNFIFPSNYAFKSKLFGIIDYTSAIVNLIWYIFIFCLVNLFFSDINIKIILFISLCFPFLIFTIVNNRNENILFVLLYVIKFMVNRKIYFYRKY